MRSNVGFQRITGQLLGKLLRTWGDAKAFKQDTLRGHCGVVDRSVSQREHLEIDMGGQVCLAGVG